MSVIPRVSVVIPCYNSRSFILEALDSVRAQQIENLEVIVVDDGSTDDSVDLVKAHYPQVRIISQPNAGPAAARNRGVREAQGRYIAFLDADDIWLEGKLQAQLRVLDQHPEIAVCYGQFKPWQGDCKGSFIPPADTSPVSANQEPLMDHLLPLALLFDAVVWTPTVLVRAEQVGKALWFDEALDVGEDYDLWLRLSLSHRFAFLPVPVALYRDNPASITKSVPRCNFEKLVVEQGVQRLCQQAPRGMLKYVYPAIEQRLSDLDYSYGRACFLSGRRTEAHEALSHFLARRRSMSASLMRAFAGSPRLYGVVQWLLGWRRIAWLRNKF